MKDLLSDNTFDIPSYQRLYSWGRQEAEDLLNDVINVTKRRRYLHFFGNIITFPISNKSNADKALIDGQQRTTTSMVLIAIIRDIAKSLINKLPQKQRNLNDINAVRLNNIKMEANTMLFGNNYKYGTDLLTLHIQDINDNRQQDYKEFFNGMIIDDKDHSFSRYLNRKYEPIRLLNNVHNVLRGKLHDLINQEPTIAKKTKFLCKLFHAFVNQFYVIVMKANSRPEALTIYMTLNTRGKGLSVPDVIKGDLAGLVNHKRNQSVKRLMKRWDNIMSSLNDQTKEVSNFLRLYWTAAHKHVYNIRDLPRSVVRRIDTSDKANAMINDLNELMPVYKELLDPQSVSTRQLTILDDKIEILNQIGLIHYYPLILAMYHNHYNNKDLTRIFNAIINIEMRVAVCNNTKPTYDELIRYIWDNPDYDFNKIIQILNKSRISDNTTYLACRAYQRRLTKSGKGKFVSLMAYIIAKYYVYHYHDFQAQQSIYKDLFSRSKYVLIRIDNNDQDVMDDLGNYTLIESNLESQLKNNNIDNLVSVLNRSNLRANHALTDMIIANANQLDSLVNKRQNNLAKSYIKIW